MSSDTMDKNLIGKWVYENGLVRKDEVCEQIEWLLQNQLTQVGTDSSGWDTLYVNPSDHSFWELIYPQSENHTGGPPALIRISKEESAKKYGEF